MSTEKVKRYRAWPSYVIVEDDGNMLPPGASEPMVLASAYDALISRCAELEKALADVERLAMTDIVHSS